MVPQPLAQGLLTQQEPGEWEPQLVPLCQQPGQPQGPLQLQPVAHEQCQSETQKLQLEITGFTKAINNLKLFSNIPPSHRFPTPPLPYSVFGKVARCSTEVSAQETPSSNSEHTPFHGPAPTQAVPSSQNNSSESPESKLRASRSDSRCWAHYMIDRGALCWACCSALAPTLPNLMTLPQRCPIRGLTSFGGGPSTVMETKFSPRSNTRPSTRFSSRSGCFAFFGLDSRSEF